VNDDEIWGAIDLQRQRTADLLEGLSDEQWQHPSLCPGWTVRDVAAHLTLQEITVTGALLAVIKHPGDLGGLNRMIRRSAQHRAHDPVQELVRDLRATIGSRRHNVGVTAHETLIDILVHGQDIAIPLGLDLRMPAAAAAAAAEQIWSYGGRGKARVFDATATRPFRYRATDVGWSAGTGPEVEGPISSLLLLLAGRRVALPNLSGAGADALRAQLSPV
jgi:uncharacterized protein (TIGR03083 family)